MLPNSPDVRKVALGADGIINGARRGLVYVDMSSIAPLVSREVAGALADKGIPTVLTGFDLPEGNIHSPNERLLVEHITLAVDAARELFRAFAELRTSAEGPVRPG